MPVMDGLTATGEIRKWEAEQGRTPTPIVALTVSALDDDIRRNLEAGCTRHVSKPVKPVKKGGAAAGNDPQPGQFAC